MDDEVEFEINVTDDQGKPLDGATIWFFGDTSNRTDLKVDDLQRLVRRYHRDVDFIFEHSLHPELLIERTRDTGRAVVRRDDADLGELASVRIFIAVLKRGWRPEVVSRSAKKGSHEKIAVQLKRDPAWKFDPRLERLDHLRAIAAAEADSEEVMTPSHQAALEHIGSELRTLADRLTKDGEPDAAAAIYYNLAYLPGVAIDIDSSSGIRTRQYTRGFDAQRPRRVADRALAWKLLETRPALQYEALLEKYKDEGLLGGPNAKRHEVRVRYLADTEKFFQRYPEAMWPPFHLHLWRIYGAEGNADQACSALRAFFDFEPTYFTLHEWQDLLELYEADVRLFGTAPSRKCVLPGLSPGAA